MSYNVLVAGQEGVGKSTYIKALVTGIFDRTYTAGSVKPERIVFDTNYGDYTVNLYEAPLDKLPDVVVDGIIVLAGEDKSKLPIPDSSESFKLETRGSDAAMDIAIKLRKLYLGVPIIVGTTRSIYTDLSPLDKDLKARCEPYGFILVRTNIQTHYNTYMSIFRLLSEMTRRPDLHTIHIGLNFN